MAAHLKLLVCITVFGCLLRSASCENKKKIFVKVQNVVKHVHHTHLEPVHVHNIHHQKKNHHHNHEEKVSVGKSGWESRAHEKPHMMMMPLLAPKDSGDHLLDSYEYGRESFWGGGSVSSQGKRRQPYWGGSLEEPNKWSNAEVPKSMSRGQGDYGEEWLMSDEGPAFRGGLGFRGGKEVLGNERKKDGRNLSWRSNQEDGWKPIPDYSHWNDERLARGKENANVENQYKYSGEITDGEDQEYRQTEEIRHRKGKKKVEKKPKWSKQIQEGELISEQEMKRIIESLQLDQRQQQIQEQIQPQQHQEYRLQQQQQISLQPTVQQQQRLPQLQQYLPQEQHYQPQQQQNLPQEQHYLPQQQHRLPQQQQYLPQEQHYQPQQQKNLPQEQHYLPQQQQVQQTIQPVYRVQNPIARPTLPQIQPQHVSQPQLGSSWSQLTQQKKPAGLTEPQHWTSPQTQPLTTHSPKMVWSGLHLELPQTTMWHVQQHDVGSTSGLPVQVISSSHRKPVIAPEPTTQPQTLASNPSLHQVLPPAGWPMNQKSQNGVKQKWEQSVQTSGRDGPASSYKLEVINYLDNKRV